jgi:hypothetical protein
MTFEELEAILQKTGLPVTFHHWALKPPRAPYLVYLDEYTNNFPADNKVYSPVTHYLVELYEYQRDRAVEEKVEQALDEGELYWDRDSNFIESIGMYQVTYEIEV